MWIITSLLVAVGLVVAGLLLTAGFTIVYVKQQTRGKVQMFILGPDKRITRRLATVGVDDKVIIGSGDEEETYIISGVQYWSDWPPGVPPLLREPVPTYVFIRNREEPVNLETPGKSLVSAKSLRVMQDEQVLRSLWKDIRQEMGVSGKAKWGDLSLWVSMASLVLVLVAMYLIWQVSSDLSWVKTTLGG